MAKQQMIIRLTQEEIQYILDNANKQSMSEITSWIGCCPQTVRYHMRKAGIKPENVIRYSVSDTFTILSMIRHGYTYREIAEELGTNKISIARRVAYLRHKGIPIERDNRKSKYASKRFFQSS